MMTNYVRETDEQMRQMSNRTFQRIAASLPANVSKRYGYDEPTPGTLQDRLKAAIRAQDWELAAKLSADLAKQERQEE